MAKRLGMNKSEFIDVMPDIRGTKSVHKKRADKQEKSAWEVVDSAQKAIDSQNCSLAFGLINQTTIELTKAVEHATDGGGRVFDKKLLRKWNSVKNQFRNLCIRQRSEL